MNKLLTALLLAVSAPWLAIAQPAVDADRLLADVRYLASDQLQGRAVGSEGSRLARWRIRERFTDLGLLPFEGETYDHRFVFTEGDAGEEQQGVNVVGYLRGAARPDSFLVVTAHYDHEGVKDGEIYNGADDNASGVSALLAIAAHFAEHPPRHSILFAALDAEEVGLKGAFSLVEALRSKGVRPLLNVNMDMVSRSEKGVLYAAGTYHYPSLKPILERAGGVEGVRLRFGHDSPDLPPDDDWTLSSDHAAFHVAGIPFVYFGVEDHEDYHRPTDDFERIDSAFFEDAVTLIIGAVSTLDASL